MKSLSTFLIESSKDDSKQIREILKKLGYSNKDVSVKSTYDTIHVIAKNYNVDVVLLEYVFKKFQSIDRDERSGEILSGGNNFVFVNYDYDVLDNFSKLEEIIRIKNLVDSQESSDVPTVYKGVNIYKFDKQDYQFSYKKTSKNMGRLFTKQMIKIYNNVESAFFNSEDDLKRIYKKELSIISKIKNESLYTDYHIIDDKELETLYEEARNLLREATSPSRVNNVIHNLEYSLEQHKTYLQYAINMGIEDVDVNDALQRSNDLYKFIQSIKDEYIEKEWKSVSFDTWEMSAKVFD